MASLVQQLKDLDIEFEHIEPGYYRVKRAGILLAEVCKERHQGTGRASARYTGYVPSWTDWAIEMPNKCTWKDTLSEVKQWLIEHYERADR